MCDWSGRGHHWRGLDVFVSHFVASAANAQVLGYSFRTPQNSFPSDGIMMAPRHLLMKAGELPGYCRRGCVAHHGVMLDDRRSRRHSHHRYRQHHALLRARSGPRHSRHGVGVGREGFTWSGVQTISRKAEWPDWHPPAQMIARQPYLPRFMAGGPGNPLGARAMYLGSSEYRIHGTNDPAARSSSLSLQAASR